MREPVVMDDWDADGPEPADAPRFWPAWLWPVLVWLPLDAWHSRFARELPVAGAVLERTSVAPETLAWVATAAVALAALAEAAFYRMLWAARGRRLPLAAAFVAVLQAGVPDLVALRVLELAGDRPPAWVAALAGARASWADGRAGSALEAAFGAAGLLALARLAIFAGLQAGLVRCRFREAFALTCAVWLASRVAQWWLAELLAGRGIFR